MKSVYPIGHPLSVARLGRQHGYCIIQLAFLIGDYRLNFRKFIPKDVLIEQYSAERILPFADEMNVLPRKQLGYQTPEELFEEFLDKVYSLNST